MKKLLLITASCLLVSIAFAQRTTFGIKAGLNIANLNVEGVDDLDSRLAFHIGGLAHIHISDHFGIQPELVYSGQGMKQDFGGGDEVDWKLGYINIPVMFQYMLGTGFRLQAGPQVGILMSAEVESGDDEEDIKDALKGIDFGIGLGVGYLTKSGFGIDARYNLGITDINDTGGNEIRNRVFQIGVFYQFGGTK